MQTNTLVVIIKQYLECILRKKYRRRPSFEILNRLIGRTRVDVGGGLIDFSRTRSRSTGRTFVFELTASLISCDNLDMFLGIVDYALAIEVGAKFHYKILSHHINFFRHKTKQFVHIVAANLIIPALRLIFIWKIHK